MNPIQTKAQIDFYNDLTSSARFKFSEYYVAANDVINEFMDQMIGDDDGKLPQSFQLTQQVRDSIYNLITEATPTVTDGAVIATEYYSSIPSHINIPIDYYAFISLSTISGGIENACKPTSYGELLPLIRDSFKHPTNSKTYYNEDATGIDIWRGDSGSITARLTYIREPVPFSIGSETDTITNGGVLTIAVQYYAMEVSVYLNVTYQIGDTITGTGVALTSGLVIPVAKTSPLDLPEKVQSDICKKISSKMLATIQMLEQSMAIEKEANKPA